MWPPPQTTAVTVNVPTRFGVSSRSDKAPVPTWPLPLPPQHQTELSDRMAQLWSPPAATYRAPLDRPFTFTAPVEAVVLWLPSWPLPLSPQQ